MNRPLFLMAGGFVLGEVLGLSERSAVAMVLMAAAAAAILLKMFKDRNGPIFGLLLIFLLSGFLRGKCERDIFTREAALELDGMQALVTGRVEKISRTQNSTQIILRPDDDDLRYLCVYLTGGETKNGDEPSIGIKVRVSGKYSVFDTATNPGQFDFRGYYRAQKLTYRFFADDLEVISKKSSLYDKYRDVLRRLSGRFSDILGKIADPGDAGILNSLLLGDKRELDSGVRDLYQKNGISHLLAISGLHLSLISAAVYGILRHLGLGLCPAGLTGGVILLSYCIMSGASVSSLRALIMLILGYLAAWKGRTYDLLTSLGIAAVLLFFDSPYQLTQAGPLLSFLAILGIAASSAISEGTSDRKSPGIKSTIGGMIRSSAAVSLITAPVIIWNFFRFPLYGILINLFVLPLMSFVVASGAAGILTGMISLSLGRFFLGMAHYILLWYDLLCRFFGSLPFSSLLLGRPAPVQICVYYCALTLIFLYMAGKKRGDKVFFCMAPLILLLFPLPVLNCNIIFMDVGQGDGILIRSEAGVILVDGGSSSVSDLYSERLGPCLESQAISQIDIAIVSHGHSDHVSGLYMLLSEESPVHVKNLIIPAAGRGDEIYDTLRERAENSGTKAFWMEKGDAITFGKMSVSCLYPSDSGGLPDADANEHSLLLRLDYGDFSMITGGDMTVNGEYAVLQDEKTTEQLRGAQVLKIGHHGSSTSTSGDFLDAIHPSWAVISYGKNNIYGHPAGQTLNVLDERGITVYETARDGAILLWTDGKKIRWNLARRLPGAYNR